MTGEFNALGKQRRTNGLEALGASIRDQAWPSNVVNLESILNSNAALGTQRGISPLWNQAIKNANGGGLAREMVRAATATAGLNAWHTEFSRPRSSLAIPITSHLTGATHIVNNSLRELMKSQQIFGEATRYPLGKVNAFQALGETSMLKLARSGTFRSLWSESRSTVYVDEPLKEFLADNAFQDLLREAEQRGIDALTEDEQIASTQTLEERPEIVAIVEQTRGYASLTPGQWVLVLGLVSVTVWLVVAFGVLYVQTEFPWTKELLDDLGLTPHEAGLAAGGLVGLTATIDTIRTTKRPPAETTDN